MLILKRGFKEDVVVEHGGERLIITVLESRCQFARLGFEGSGSFRIARREIMGPGGEFPDGFGNDR